MDAHETISKVEKPLVLLTFLSWHLFRKHNTKRKPPNRVVFVLVADFVGWDLSLTAFGTKARPHFAVGEGMSGE